ncbi:hypothetical protein ACJMK2_000684, partial [Sinanodonta woodiana]
LTEIWLNSIHSCAPFSHSGIPPVILVGTHVDKIPKKGRQKVIEEYFMKIRQMLKDKPVVLHLMDNIAIDNTICDPRLEDLKRRIFQLASLQPHWGEEKPARWLPLEQAIMTMKASGVKVAPLSLIEQINRSSSIRIDNRDELEVFLCFQHDIGSILYFNAVGLREKIVLDPQWMIDALKSLITARMFIVQNPAITNAWYAFEKEGKLTDNLIDAIWNKKEKPDFHDNKEHILLVMEKLNIIARPMSCTEDGKSVKKEDYYLAPCILKQETPKELICPVSDPEMRSTSALCFVCKEQFLPPPIFHRLVGACLTHWPIAKQDDENLIYCGCCLFDIDNYHRLSLHFLGHVIFARVTIMGVADIRHSSKLCSEARKFIFKNLLKIIGNLGQSLEFEPHIQCHHCDADSLKGIFAVPRLQKETVVVCHSHVKSHTLESQQLLKFWFEDGERTVAEGKRRGKWFKVDKTGVVPDTSGNKEKLHETVLNRCLPNLLKDLNVRDVMMFIQQKELFDTVTIRDINEQITTTDKISHLVDQITKREQDTYERFKKCLILAQRADLKVMLEEEEENIATEMKEKHQGCMDRGLGKEPYTEGTWQRDM